MVKVLPMHLRWQNPGPRLIRSSACRSLWLYKYNLNPCMYFCQEVLLRSMKALCQILQPLHDEFWIWPAFQASQMCLQERRTLLPYACICTFHPFCSNPASLSQLSMTPDLVPRIDTTVNAQGLRWCSAGLVLFTQGLRLQEKINPPFELGRCFPFTLRTNKPLMQLKLSINWLSSHE